MRTWEQERYDGVIWEHMSTDDLAAVVSNELSGGDIQISRSRDKGWRVDWHRGHAGIMSDMRTVDGLASLKDALCAVMRWEAAEFRRLERAEKAGPS